MANISSEIMQEKLSAWARDAVEQDERWLRQLKVVSRGRQAHFLSCSIHISAHAL